MPMDRRPILGAGNVVVDGDLKSITPVGLERRARESTINENRRPLKSIWSNGATRDGQVVTPRHAGVWRVGIRVSMLARG